MDVVRSLVGFAVAVAAALAGPLADAARVAPAEVAPAESRDRESLEYSNGHPRNARITIPARDIKRLPVIAYRGRTDDAPGTRIQNRGIAAAPYGPNGGTGPGGIGNYQVTGHRTSHGGVFEHTPSLEAGARILIDAGRWRYVYRVVKTRWVSFRSVTSLRAQRAAVPGEPGRTATRAWLTVSTCATPEDHARGNYWTGRFGNPEHRIDKIGVMVDRIRNPYWQPKRLE
jgi:sortase A